MTLRPIASTCLACVLLLPAACNKPKLGGKCEVGQALCEGSSAVLACRGGVFVEATCHGPAGCAMVGARVTCDDSISAPGDACLEGDTENRACSADRKTSLVCDHGAFKQARICRGDKGCQIAGDAVTCDETRAVKGDGCAERGAFACAPDMKSRLVCNGTTFVTDRACKGASGCHPVDYACDETISDEGDPCGIAGMAACSSDGWTELLCKSGAWFANRSCNKGCKVVGANIECR